MLRESKSDVSKSQDDRSSEVKVLGAVYQAKKLIGYNNGTEGIAA